MQPAALPAPWCWALDCGSGTWARFSFQKTLFVSRAGRKAEVWPGRGLPHALWALWCAWPCPVPI